MNRILKPIKSFVNTSSIDKRKILIIIFLAIKVDIIIKYFPLRTYLFKYFKQIPDGSQELQPFREDICLIKRILKNLPGKLTCLNESIIVHLYFRRKGIIIPVHLGIKNSNGLQAHAWYGDSENSDFKKICIPND